MLRRIQVLDTAGDTIVEVLLAIAVVSAALGGAYASASKSSQGLRQSQERGEALKLLESQIDLLKSAKAAGYKLPDAGHFCVVQGGGRVSFPESAKSECQQGADRRYQIGISRADDAVEYEYTAIATWDKLSGGSEKEKVTIVYRVEQQ